MAKQITIAEKPDLSTPLDMQTMGEYVRYKRTSNNITLEDAASLCGLSKQAYNNVERGVANIRVDTLLKVFSAFGIKLSIQEEEQENDGW